MVRARLLKTFSPEFVNRLDSVVTFNWIERNVVARRSSYRCSGSTGA